MPEARRARAAPRRRRAGARRRALLLLAGLTGCAWSFEPTPPGDSYPARDRPAAERQWHDFDPATVAEVREIGTLRWRGGEDEPDDAEIAERAADHGGDYWIRGGGDTRTWLRYETHPDGTVEAVPMTTLDLRYGVLRRFTPAELHELERRGPRGAPARTAPALTEEASLRLYRDGNPAAAVRFASEALELDPSHVEALVVRGAAHEALARSAGHDWGAEQRLALTDYERAVALRRDDAPALRGVHGVAWSLGLPDRAREAADALVALDPRCAIDRERRLRFRLRTGDVAGAIEDAAAAIAAQPQPRATPYVTCAYLCARAGRFQEAVHDLTQALACPDSGRVLRGDRGVARRAAGDPAGARADLEAVLVGVPDTGFADVRLRCGLLALEAGDVAGALRHVEGPSQDARLRVARGVVRLAAGDEAGARAAWDQALAPGSGEPPARLARARLLLARVLATAAEARQRDPAWALALARQAVPDEARASAFELDSLAAAHAAGGAFEQAAGCQERAVAALLPDFPHAAEVYRRRLERYRQGDAPPLAPWDVFVDPATSWQRTPWEPYIRDSTSHEGWSRGPFDPWD